MNTPRLLAAVVTLLAPATVTAQAVPAPAPPALSEAALIARLTTTLDSLAGRDEFSGVVLLARAGTPVFQKAVGFADREARRPNTVETAFNLGSITKVFTATAIRQLAAQGKLNLDSTVGRYWPDYPNAAVARQVTIRHLLEHRGGLGGNIFGVPPGGTRRDLKTLRDFLPLFAAEPLQFAPGTERAYSNAGYLVLGLLVERLSGETYYDYVRQHIYKSAGLEHTAHFRSDALPAHVALGYTREGGPALVRNTDLLPGIGSSAGGGYSTPQDLARFVQALREQRVPGGPPSGLGAAGGAPGINAVLEGDLPGGYDLVVMANLDPPAAERVARLVRGWLGVQDEGRVMRRRPR
jgi:CubicO group peptidase (beta-lactamase class C family)